MVNQYFIKLRPRARGFHLITREVLSQIPELPEKGIFHLFIQHTSAGLTINENADPDVLDDFETYFNHIVPENMRGLKHTLEGSDDMPAHVKSTISDSSISIPITNGNLNTGTWQGIYLCEFRNYGGSRKLIATIMD